MKRQKILRYLERTTNYLATTKVTYICAVIEGNIFCEFNSQEPVCLGDALYALKLNDTEADIKSLYVSELCCETPTNIILTEEAV